MLDLSRVRRDFPILATKQHGHSLVYLDNAATMQMPVPVLNCITEHYARFNANVHRGVHSLSQQCTDHLENARRSVARFIGAEENEVIFTSGTTDGLNQLSRMLKPFIRQDNQILVSAMEHHSNLIPWQQLCRETGAALDIIPLNEDGDLDLNWLSQRLQKPTALISVTWVSNVLGTVNPIREISRMAHEAGALMIVDGAQGMKLEKTRVRELDCDFLAFSGHKLGALNGIGVLYGKKERLAQLQPATFGGGMVEKVEYQNSTFGIIPHCFEAGTPNYVGAISLGTAVDYLSELGIDNISEQETYLTQQIAEKLSRIDGLHILGRPKEGSGCVSFYLDDVHAFDLGVMLDTLGIAVRTGHMCAQPLVESYGISNVLRISPAFYNTDAELQQFMDALHRILPILRGKRT